MNNENAEPSFGSAFFHWDKPQRLVIARPRRGVAIQYIMRTRSLHFFNWIASLACLQSSPLGLRLTSRLAARNDGFYFAEARTFVDCLQKFPFPW